MQYCENCEQNVEPDGKVNWLIFTLLFLFLIGPGIIYLLYCLTMKDETCPQCGGNHFTAPV